ncbi:hypothetical protein Tco_0065148 [Tanacetum coccineum]
MRVLQEALVSSLAWLIEIIISNTINATCYHQPPSATTNHPMVVGGYGYGVIRVVVVGGGSDGCCSGGWGWWFTAEVMVMGGLMVATVISGAGGSVGEGGGGD